MVFHESTVGAGLPVLDTLKNLVATGDKIVKIEGIFSGTLSYRFNVFSPSNGPASDAKFSDIVKDAKAKGYTVSIIIITNNFIITNFIIILLWIDEKIPWY